MVASPDSPYPQSHRDLLEAAHVAVFSAVTPKGQLQSTAIWYLLDDDDVTSHDPPGTVRYVITIEPETVNPFG